MSIENIAGLIFSNSTGILSLPSSGKISISIDVGSDEIEIIGFRARAVAADIAIKLYEGEDHSGGNAVESIIKNRSINRIASYSIRSEVTSAPASDPIFQESPIPISGNQQETGFGESVGNWIFRKNTKYILDLENQDAQSKDIQLQFSVKILPSAF